jgi:copper chaperone CopZ
MKTSVFIMLSLIVGFGAKAQGLQNKAVWSTFTVPQMKCWECKDRLEKYLTKETGAGDANEAAIFKVLVNMFNGTVRVQYAPDRITVDYIRAAIANAGYDVDTVKANPDSYKVLPPVCKRKEEGGGPKKGVPCNIPPDGQ